MLAEKCDEKNIPSLTLHSSDANNKLISFAQNDDRLQASTHIAANSWNGSNELAQKKTNILYRS